jgi:predicted Zn-dependent protease
MCNSLTGFKLIFLAMGAGFLGILSHSSAPATAQSNSSSLALPSLQVHPLPPSLAQWSDRNQQGDYFSQVQVTDVGYLVWSQFPVKVYIEPSIGSSTNSGQSWMPAVLKAVREWQVYLPLTMTNNPQVADITIQQANPRQLNNNGRVRSAETRYQLYVNQQGMLSHRCTVTIRSSQTAFYISAAIRHELGHALGIWGHSPLETDALYFSQVRNPPSISARDINTLKRVYQQPTRLGWPLP